MEFVYSLKIQPKACLHENNVIKITMPLHS